jgi:transcriptional regulator with XRE-family HTH domain
MSQPTPPDIRAELIQARQLLEIAQLDYKRTLKEASKTLTQNEIASTVGVSQPAIAKTLQSAAHLPDVLENFDSASPYEVCQRYAAGLINRDEVIRQLAAWPYPPTPRPDEFGDFTETFEGTFDDVLRAKRYELISDADYAELFDRIVSQAAESTGLESRSASATESDAPTDLDVDSQR